MTAIDSTFRYGNHAVALQLLEGRTASSSSKSDKPMFIRSDAAQAGKAASDGIAQPRRQQREVLTLLSRTDFSTSSNDVLASLQKVFSDPNLQAEFNAKVKDEKIKARDVDHKILTADGVQMLALRDVITAHRKDFPPDAFSFRITSAEYGEDPPEPVNIPSTSDMTTQIVKGEVDKKQADYDDAVATKNAPPDANGAKLDAMQQAVSTLVLNGSETADPSAGDAQTAYALLTKKLYPDDSEDPAHPGAQTAKPQDASPGGTATPASPASPSSSSSSSRPA